MVQLPYLLTAFRINSYRDLICYIVYFYSIIKLQKESNAIFRNLPQCCEKSSVLTYKLRASGFIRFWMEFKTPFTIYKPRKTFDTNQRQEEAVTLFHSIIFKKKVNLMRFDSLAAFIALHCTIFAALVL